MMDPAERDGDGPGVAMGAQTTTPTPSRIQRQDSSNSATSKTRTRNVRNLSIAPTPASPPVTQTHSFASLSESAAAIAAQRGILSPSPAAAPRSRPGTPSLGRSPTPLLGAPRTPSHGFVPLTPTTPAGVIFSPNTPLQSPNALPSKTAKLKSQLTSFLPAKHTYFHAKIVVEQLSSVPFVGGQFGVRWKFKNVHRHASAQQEDGASEEGQGIFGRMTAKSKNGSGKDKGKAREQHFETNEFGGIDAPIPHYHPHHQDSFSSTATNSSIDTTTTSESSSSTSATTWSSTSIPSMGSNSSAATKTGSGTGTPNTNLSRNFYSAYASASSTTMSPNSREAQYGPSQYLFTASAADASSPTPALTQSDPTASLLFSPHGQSFSSNAALGPTGVLSPKSPNFNVVSPTGTVTQGRSINATPLLGGNAPLSGSQSAQIGQLSAVRGMTRYLPLKDHSINFNFPLEAIVKMDVSRSGSAATSDPGPDGTEGGLGLGMGELNPHDLHSQSSTSISSMMPQGTQQGAKPNLQPSPLKLVVMQRVVPDDPSSVPQNPRLGAVFINLAEYVGKGKVERRFLLKESRVNATLKLAIEVNYLSGYQGYVAPPLPKAEILGGIEGFLKQHDTLLSKKKVKTMGAAIGRENVGLSKDRVGQDTEKGDAGAVQQESEVDLIQRGFLEMEKDRIGQVLVANMKVTEGDFRVDGLDETSGTGANTSLSTHADVDPYALPSESESESECGAGLQGEGKSLVEMTAEALGRKQWKKEMRAKKKAEMAQRLALDLSDSEGDDSIFESADEELQDDRNQFAAKPGPAAQDPEPIHYPNQRAQIRVAAFDVQRLPLAYGPKTTESLIEALFNPGVTTDKTDDDPFVVYISPTDLKRQEAWRREEEVRLQQHALKHQEQMAMAQQQNQHQHHHDHWYRTKRSATRDSGVEESGTGLMTKLKRGVKRVGTLDSTTSESTTSGSGSGGSPEARMTSMKSPGEDTIVGVRMGQESPDVTSSATITALSPNREGQPWNPLAIAMDREATIGKGTGGSTAGVGNFLSNYYRTKKGKAKDKGEQKHHAKQEEKNVLGGTFYDQEPQGMHGSLGQGQVPTNAHQRSATVGTISSTTSSSSLSSLGLSSHGHKPVLPPLQTSPSSGGGTDVRRSSSIRSTSTGDSHLMMSTGARQRQPDFSAPPGRMDKTGVLKGTGPSPSATGDQPVEDGSGLGNSLKGWWKGLQK